jgi:hypothetical protein
MNVDEVRNLWRQNRGEEPIIDGAAAKDEN